MDAVSAAPPKLNAVRVLLAAVVAPVFHKHTLIWFALPVFAAGLASRLLESPTAGALSHLAILFTVARMIAGIVLDVACYRVFVLGPQSTAGHGLHWWVHRAARFFGWGIVIGFACFLVAIPAFIFLGSQLADDPAAVDLAAASAVTRLGVVLFALPALYLFGRLAMAFPVVATRDAPVDLAKTWQLSAGNGLRLMLIVGLLPALLHALVLFPLLLDESLPIQSIGTLLMIYIVAVQAAAVSTAYRELSPLTLPQ